MELDLQSLFGLHVHSYTHWLRPRNPAQPRNLNEIVLSRIRLLDSPVSLNKPAVQSLCFQYLNEMKKKNKTREEESAYDSKAQYYPFKPSKFALLMFLLNEYIFFKICMPRNILYLEGKNIWKTLTYSHFINFRYLYLSF
jgi:hypothetical protein